ncbi:MAG: SRPBCC family protein [Candidatus Dormibacteraceae bacterium]
MTEKKTGGSTMSQTDYVIEPGSFEIVMTRVFDAPRELVFKAYTDPQLFAQWWGPREYTNRIDQFEARRGGEWRIVQSDSSGHEFAFRGVHHDVVAPGRIVATFEFEGVPGHVLMQTTTFEALSDKTRVVQQAVFQAVADRDGMVASGMRRGSDDSMDRLSELLEKMKTP